MTVKVTKPALNLREELSSLKKPSGVAGEAMLRAETPQEQFNLIGAGRKNFIINGGSGIGVISQRGTYQNYGPVTNSKYYYDRWKAYVANITMNISHSDGWIKGTATSADGRMGLWQVVEDHTLFAGKEITVSMKVKTTNANARIGVSDGVNYTVSDPVSVCNGSETTHSLTVKVADSPTTLAVYIYLVNSSGGDTSIASSDYIEFTNVQLELGSVATPFEHRSYGEELALCQRYYYRETTTSAFDPFGCGGYGYSSTVGREIVVFPVTMRTAPTLSASAGSQFVFIQAAGNKTVTSVTSVSPTEHSMRINVNGSGFTVGDGGMLTSNSGTETYLAFDAEL